MRGFFLRFGFFFFGGGESFIAFVVVVSFLISCFLLLISPYFC